MSTKIKTKHKKTNRPRPPVIDTVLHGLIHNDSLRCAIAITTQTTVTAQEKHQLGPMATIALGRSLACTALMGSALKEDQQFVHCQISGDGPLGYVTSEYIAPASLRGYVQIPDLSATLTTNDSIPETVGDAVGKNGTVTIKRGSFSSKDPYTGISALISGEIAQDIALYFAESEQIPSIISAGVKLDKTGKVLAAGGILIQKIGGDEVGEETLKEFEERAAQLNLSERIAEGASLQELFSAITDMDASTLDLASRPLGFHCFCSREKMAITLMNLGESELRSIQEDVGKIEMTCHYCSTKNLFSLEELLKH